MTIQSFTNPEVHYETDLEHCTCGDFINRKSKTGGHCKHQQSIIIAAFNRMQRFDLLRMKFDSRLNGDLDTRRCYVEMALGF